MCRHHATGGPYLRTAAPEDFSRGVLPSIKNRLIGHGCLANGSRCSVRGLLLFLPAGTLSYWEAWVYLALLFLPVGRVGLIILSRVPDLLERRMRSRDT